MKEKPRVPGREFPNPRNKKGQRKPWGREPGRLGHRLGSATNSQQAWASHSMYPLEQSGMLPQELHAPVCKVGSVLTLSVYLSSHEFSCKSLPEEGSERPRRTGGRLPLRLAFTLRLVTELLGWALGGPRSLRQNTHLEAWWRSP